VTTTGMDDEAEVEEKKSTKGDKNKEIHSAMLEAPKVWSKVFGLRG